MRRCRGAWFRADPGSFRPRPARSRPSSTGRVPASPRENARAGPPAMSPDGAVSSRPPRSPPPRRRTAPWCRSRHRHGARSRGWIRGRARADRPACRGKGAASASPTTPSTRHCPDRNWPARRALRASWRRRDGATAPPRTHVPRARMQRRRRHRSWERRRQCWWQDRCGRRPRRVARQRDSRSPPAGSRNRPAPPPRRPPPGSGRPRSRPRWSGRHNRPRGAPARAACAES